MNSPDPEQLSAPDRELKALAESARVLVVRKDFSAAEDVYRRILAAAPYHVQALKFLSRQSYARGDYPQALELTLRALERAPHDALLHQNRGLILWRMQEFDAALRSLDESLELRPQFPLALLNKSRLLKEMGRREPALDSALAAWRLLPDPEGLANDDSQPENVRALIREASELIRDGQLALLNEELRPVVEEFGRPAIERVLTAAEIYTGLQSAAPGSGADSTTALIVPGLSETIMRSASAAAWCEAVRTRMPQLRIAAAEVFSSEPQPSTGPEPPTDIRSNRRPRIFNLPEKHKHIDQLPVLAELFDILPLIHDPELPTGISFIEVPTGIHSVNSGNGGNWKLTVYVPLSGSDDAVLQVGTEEMHLEQGAGIHVSERAGHTFRVTGSESLVLLSFAVMNPDLGKEEASAVRAVMRALRHFQMRRRPLSGKGP